MRGIIRRRYICLSSAPALRWLAFEHPNLAAQKGVSRSPWGRFDLEFVLPLRCGAMLATIRRLYTCLSGAPVLRWLAFEHPSLAAQKGVTRSLWGKLDLELVLPLRCGALSCYNNVSTHASQALP